MKRKIQFSSGEKIIIEEFHQKRKMKVGRKRIKKGKERCVLALHQACTYRQKAPCMYIEKKKLQTCVRA